MQRRETSRGYYGKRHAYAVVDRALKGRVQGAPALTAKTDLRRLDLGPLSDLTPALKITAATLDALCAAFRLRWPGQSFVIRGQDRHDGVRMQAQASDDVVETIPWCCYVK